ncbi:MAG: DUF6526 family protein [Acidobacteriota bacterium]|nr:DUF6526 family protein [Acidobacteriota bacterium]
MADTPSQNVSNHSRYHPLYHFILFPILFIYLILTVVQVVRDPGFFHLYSVVVALAFLIMAWLIRAYPLKVQDRLIRLEETLRCQRVLDEPLRSRIGELRPRHCVALRFASDEELPELVERILAGELNTQKEIKQAIRSWRPDHFRV